jgi:hypothetical protein
MHSSAIGGLQPLNLLCLRRSPTRPAGAGYAASPIATAAPNEWPHEAALAIVLRVLRLCSLLATTGQK